MFKLNDQVTAFGLDGQVIEIADPKDKITFPVKVRFISGNCSTFTLDGKYDVWHVEPSLKKK